MTDINPFAALAAAIHREGAAALVTVAAAEGSAPREAGARMVVRPSGAFQGTIGGGALEWEAMAEAHRALKLGRGPAIARRIALGPQLGQCCGGRADLRIETFAEPDLPELERWAAASMAGPLRLNGRLDADGRVVRSAKPFADRRPADFAESFGPDQTSLLLFGAGHVGRALVLALAPLPFRVRWIDSRPDAFPEWAPANVTRVASEHVEPEIDAAPDGAFLAVMSHSHPLDLQIVSHALQAERFGYVGLIGSATKRARFLRIMREAGLPQRALAGLTCPIGVPGISDKAPAAIAASVAAELLIERSRLRHTALQETGTART